MNPISVLLVEDHQIVRQGLRLLIEAQPNLKVIGEVSNGKDAIAAILESNPDVVVFDISMPEMNGIEMVKELRRLQNNCRLLALTANSDRAYLTALIQLGISGYLLKRSAANELIEAIHRVASNGNFLDPDIVREMGEGVFSPKRFSTTTVGSATAVIMSSSPERKAPPPTTASRTSAAPRPIGRVCPIHPVLERR